MIVERLCGKLFLLVDRDDENNKSKRERHQFLSDTLGDRFHRLDCREVENLLTPLVLKSVISTLEGRELSFKHFTQSQYKTRLLGKYISDSIINDNPKRTYHTDSGALADKITFCQIALENMHQFSDLSPEAQAITEKLYNFIQVQNP